MERRVSNVFQITRPFATPDEGAAATMVKYHSQGVLTANEQQQPTHIFTVIARTAGSQSHTPRMKKKLLLLQHYNSSIRQHVRSVHYCYCPGSRPASIQSAVFVQALAMTSYLGLHSTRPTDEECPLRTFTLFPSLARQT